MINFEEELKKFGPSMEIEEVENAVRDHELTDMTDIMFAMLRTQNELQSQVNRAQNPVAVPTANITPMQP